VRKHLRPEELGDLLEQPLVAVLATYPPYRGIELHTEPRLEYAGDTLRRIAIRYLGERDGAAYADSGADDTIIRLEPGHVRAWDFADQL
jgi:hypothetical protein